MTERWIGAAAAIFDDRGRILLVRHNYEQLNWEIPGGIGEPGESAAETARREVREELGLDVEIERLPRPISTFTVLRIRDAASGAVPRLTTIGRRVWLE